MNRMASLVAIPAALLVFWLGAGATSRDLSGSPKLSEILEAQLPELEPDVIFSSAGVTEPRSKTLKIMSELPGTIQAIHFRAGDRITRGDVLAELQNEIQVAGVSLAQAGLERARAELERLTNGDRPQERAIAHAQLREAEAALRTLDIEIQRLEHMRSVNAASEKELTDARNSRDMAAARCDAARQRSELAELAPRSDDLARAQAAVREAEARLDGAKFLLEKTWIRAPIDGVVLYRFLEPGEVVYPELAMPILTIGDRSELHVRVDVDELDIAQVRQGQSVFATAPAYGERRFPGRVVHIEPTLGRKNFRTNRPTERIDSKVQEVVVALDDGGDLPVELQMVVWFRSE